jgi:alkanesulfonate monooxygenase SsuD/methylene tetrahydromethanopterin reductase-like flavin-dependent oxidoreductase (luciferase family)
MASGANIMATPLSRPHAEVGILGQRFADTLAKLPAIGRPRFLMLRRTCVCAQDDDWVIPVQISAEYNRRFESLFRNVGVVENGFPEPAAWEQIADRDAYSPDAVRDGMVVGTPQQVVARLQHYAAAGVDQFCYGASFGLPHEAAMRSLELFITEVMPHFSA